MTEKSITKLTMKSIQVFVRIRPFQANENVWETCIESVDENCVTVIDQHKEKQSFTFDRVFPEEICQKEIYETIGKDVLESAFRGVNGTIFCYGQTSSGKTHTVIGPNFCEKNHRMSESVYK